MARLSCCLDLSLKDLERVLYCEAYIVTDAGTSGLEEATIIDEETYYKLVEEGVDFTAAMGGEAAGNLTSDATYLLCVGLRSQTRRAASRHQAQQYYAYA